MSQPLPDEAYDRCVSQFTPPPLPHNELGREVAREKTEEMTRKVERGGHSNSRRSLFSRLFARKRRR